MQEVDSTQSSTSGCKIVVGLGDGSMQSKTFLLAFQGQLHPLTQGVFSNPAVSSTTVI